jgi:hypothetical protein
MSILFGEKRTSPFRAMYVVCANPGTPPIAKHEEFKEFDLPPEGRKVKFLEFLGAEIDRLERHGKLMKDYSAHQERMESRSAGIPEANRLDRLLKYSATLERDFERTLNQLERLQRIRKGQPVPPTLNVNFST